MDFSPDPEQQAVADVVTSVLDRDNSWEALVAGGVTALAVPERLGGDGVGLSEVATALTEIGRHGTISPALATLGFGLVPLLELATEAQQDRYLAGVAKGAVLTAALDEPAAALPEQPGVRLSGNRLSGTKIGVPFAEQAEWMLVTADSGVAVISPKAPGVQLTKTPTANHSNEYVVVFDGAEADAVLDGASVHRVNHLALAMVGAYTSGLVAGALRLTADYVGSREQFGRPLSTFQTVAAQLSEIYIVSRTITLAATSVVWRLANGLDAGDDLGVLGYWITSQAPPVMQLCHHLHGGMGMDVDYPMDRYYSTIKDLNRLLGGRSHRLDLVEVGSAAEPGEGQQPAAAGTMFVDLTPEQRKLQAELREYFANLITPDEEKAMATDRHNEAYRAVIRRMGRDGKLGVGWPKEFGGLGFGPIEQQIFVNEAQRADIPLPAVTLQTVGPTLQVYGNEAQKKKFLPDILAGEVHFAIGYSEPEAGTDLASLRTTAVRDGDHYIVNGQKVFTTGAHDADYIWLAVRTDPTAVKHKGISILIVDTKDPGYSWTPMILSDGAHHTNATYYNDVRVPADMLVGEENGGWKLITTQLNNERVMLGPAGRFGAIYDKVYAWATQPGSDGITPISHDAVKRGLGEIHAMFRINELLNWQVAAAGEIIDVADAAATKVFGTERIQYAGRLAEEIVGCYGNPADPATTGLLRWLDVQTKRNLVITFGGGVNEVMREMIAASGLKVPRVPR
ncbi:acyl-CoA dehydrogenase [Mycolicibacter sinensis]|uniref:Acyl-CoA dehydrogenase n=2 Tax=Mycolicibacter sinensis (strain JDM601) TaxID=875328 RepID=A0A1A3U1B8_MYCSD|nr:acyl-CoA dehydrogenase [Mycolicibacter sinensis]